MSETKYLSKDEIANANVLTEESFEVPEWNGTILLRELSGLDRDKFEGQAVDPLTGEMDMEKLREMQARLVQLSIIDPDTNRRMFASEKDFIQFVARFKAPALHRIAAKCLELNGMDNKTREADAKKSSAESGSALSTS